MKTRRLLISALAVFAVLAAACGGNDDDDNAGANTGGGDGNGTETVRLTNFGHFVSTIQWDHATLAGYFDEEGIDLVETAPIYNAAQIVQAMEQGDADIAFTGGSGVVGAAAAGRDIKIIANVVVGLQMKVVLATDTLERLEAEGITSDSPLEDKVEALRGMTLSGTAAGSTGDVAFRYAVGEYGLDPDSDLTIQPLGDSAAISAAVRERQVDGMFVLAGGSDVQAELEGWGEVFLNFADGDTALNEFPQFVLATTSSFIEKNPDAVRAVVAAFARSWDEVKAGLDDDQIAAVKAEYLADMDQDHYDAALESFVAGLDNGAVTPTQAEFESLLAVTNASADNPVDLDFDELYDTSIVEGMS